MSWFSELTPSKQAGKREVSRVFISETEHLVLGFIGVSFVVQSGGIGVTWSQLGGDLLALGAAGAWAWYGLAIGPLVGALGTVRATGWTMVIAALCCTPLVLVETRDYAWRSVSWEAWAGLVYGATVGMVTAMTL